MKIHILGICGTAMASLAGMLKQKGHEIRGSDQAVYPPMSDLLLKLSIHVYDGYKKENLEWKPDLIVVGNVIRRTNEEACAAREANIEQISMPQALKRFFLLDKHSVVISGTHGKTTISSLMAHLLFTCGLEPSFMIGGIPLNFESNYRLGNGEYFVVEGDEYDTAYFDKEAKFFHYMPQTALINNIEYDHADIFPDLDKIINVFKKFAHLIPPNGTLIASSEDLNIYKILDHLKCRIISFGIQNGDYSANDICWNADGVNFTLIKNEKKIETFQVPLWGRHNLHNIIGSLALCMELKSDPALLKKGVLTFKNVKKRQELLAKINNIAVIDDFAHHPTAIRETIRAVKLRFPEQRIITLFEPESNTSRRRVFQENFVKAFSEADVILFTSPLEKNDNLSPEEKIDMKKLVNDIKACGKMCRMIQEIDELADFTVSIAEPFDVILGMSGRDFKGLHRKIIQRLSKKYADKI